MTSSLVLSQEMFGAFLLLVAITSLQSLSTWWNHLVHQGEKKMIRVGNYYFVVHLEKIEMMWCEMGGAS